MNTHSKKKDTGCLFSYRGVNVNFPFQPYDIQREYMQRVIDSILDHTNAMLESPTGTGKTLCLLCASLAATDFKLRDYTPTQYTKFKMSFQGAIEDDSDRKHSKKFGGFPGINQCSIPPEKVAGRKIVYCSRTHSQIKQIVRELKKTIYRPKLIALGSREQMCTNPEVNRESPYAQRILCKNKSLNCPYHANLSNSERINIYYNKNLQNNGMMDIEDLYKYGRKHRICPYYLSRNETIMIESEVALMPYNYIMDSYIRSKLPFDLTHCIILIDEAHNIDSFCLESVSFDISAKLLNKISNEIKDLACDNISSKLATLNMDDAELQNQLATINETEIVNALTIIEHLETKITEHLQSSDCISDWGHMIYPFLAECGIDVNSIKIILPWLNDIIEWRNEFYPNATYCATETLQQFLFMLFPNNGDDERLQNLIPTKVEAIMKLNASQRNHIQEIAEGQKQLPRRTADKWSFVLYYQEERAYNAELHKYEMQKFPCMGFWCMDCSIAMNALQSTGVDSIIFTSGTLSPMNPLITEFQIPITHTLENLHVIQSSQLLLASVSTGVNGEALSSSYAARQNDSMKSSLADTILYFAPSIPGNIIVFFPSYSYLNACWSYWEDHFITQKMRDIKEVYKEETKMTSEDFTMIVTKLQKASRLNGAFLFAVCRGKASEGIDFSDAMCRCVMIAGIPYPPFQDRKVKARRQYLDEKAKQQLVYHDRYLQAKRHNQQPEVNYPDLPLAIPSNQVEPFSGDDWYMISAHRAVNQAVGRTIRHRDDYGVILLLDERFTSPRSVDSLSKWLQPFYQQMTDMPSLLQQIETLFSQNGSGYKVSKFVRRHTEPVVGIPTFGQSLRIQPKEKSKEVHRPNLSTSLFSKLKATKSKSFEHLSETQSDHKKKELVSPTTSVRSIDSDSDDEGTSKLSLKRSSFVSHIKTEVIQMPVVKEPSIKGIKRFFDPKNHQMNDTKKNSASLKQKSNSTIQSFFCHK